MSGVRNPAVSLVVASYEMARVLPRTLRSLLPPYQRDLDPDMVEIIVVDNGSSVLPDTGSFESLGAVIRLISVAHPTPSPVAAVNAGIAAARANLIGVWIDGARLASPGLVGACLKAATLHQRPVIATVNYQLGPTRQYLSAQNGYGPGIEDALLASISWPDDDGYRLFDIATCEVRGGPTGAMLESNALFLPRDLWQELGGYDPAFVEPGGGMVNPDTLIRACGLPDVQLIRILGEGTFHQYHGGLSTSTADGAMQVLQQGSRVYLQRRGKPLVPVRAQGWHFDGRRRVRLDAQLLADGDQACPAA